MSSDPHEAIPRLKQFAKNEEEEQFLLQMNQWLRAAPLAPSKADCRPEKMPLIYIVGAPRSGTTLLHQLICRYLPVGYINNLIARFWLRPSVGIRLSQAILGNQARQTITFHSRHGVSEGIAGPHEFGYFWRHWLQLDRARTHHLSEAELESLDHIGLKHSLENEIIAAFGGPVVFKNVICGFHASFLSRLHPASIFVYIKRDAYATAASILSTRKERYGSYDAWWSLKPSSYPFDLPIRDAVSEVVRQVIDSRREMEQELSRPGIRVCFITYEELCKDPQAILASVCRLVQECGTSLDRRSEEIPAFRVSPAPVLPEDIERRLRRELEAGLFHNRSCDGRISIPTC